MLQRLFFFACIALHERDDLIEITYNKRHTINSQQFPSFKIVLHYLYCDVFVFYFIF